MKKNNDALKEISVSELKEKAKELRIKIIEVSHKSKATHLGSALSCVDILTALYWKFLNIDPSKPNDSGRDRFILSKGHAATALYVSLEKKHFFPTVILDDYLKNGSCLAGHPGPNCAPGIEAATGALGHGLPIGVGISLAGKIQKKDYRVFVLIGDGECNEGSIWEAAMFASSQKLDNLIVIIDYNKWQATGRSKEILCLEPLKNKWDSFGFNTFEINGNNMNDLVETLKKVPLLNGKPTAIIAHTIKGKGVSFMEDDNNWHYKIPSEDEVKKARGELESLQKEELNVE